LSVYERLRDVVAGGGRAVCFTVVEGDGLGSKLLVLEGGETFGDGPAELAEGADELILSGRSRVLQSSGRKVFADVFGPPPRLLVIGAIDTANALCEAAGRLGWHTIVADARGRFATPERVTHADELLVAWPEEALERVRPDHGTAVVVLTHDDKFDLPALKGALETDAFYVGALGSRRNQARRRERLLAEGVDEDALDRISGPCGLDLGADSPAETAISILAEILAVRAGREGGRLRDSVQRIHVETA
jgi:xanthine dehydrogenase accessory factor